MNEAAIVIAAFSNVNSEPENVQMTDGRATYQIVWEGDRLLVNDVVIRDEKTWAGSVGFPETLKLTSAVGMMRKNVGALLDYQTRAFREGPAFVAPLRVEDFEHLGGDSGSTVSRVLRDSFLLFDGEPIAADYFISPGVLDDIELSGLQLRVLCVAAREILGKTSDQNVADLLARAGVSVARRTVNKYARESRGELAPTRMLAEMLRLLLTTIRSEADVARLVVRMTEHNAKQLARIRAGADPTVRRRAELRELLLRTCWGLADGERSFADLVPGEQETTLDALVEVIHERLRNGN